MDIGVLLEPYRSSGVNLGLTRIHGLLAKLGHPEKKVAYVHVGGTNGKGSVCAYLSAVLTTAGYRVGRYTSPHLINWNERVWVNGAPVDDRVFIPLLQEVMAIAPPGQGESPTLFEIFTAAVWLYFAQLPVDIAVMEVGLGGRLDATNVEEPCLLSVITSLSREHWQILGPTVADIAREKAGILKAHRPVFLGAIPPQAEPVFRARIAELPCPDHWVSPATPMAKDGQPWARWQNFEYPLPLLGDFQLQNSALAIAVLQELRHQGWSKINPTVIRQGMAQARWPGRLQWIKYQEQEILLDGAHNPAAAKALADYVHGLGASAKPITWIMGMLKTKEHDQIFAHLLRPGDRLLLVPVPDHDSAEPRELAKLAQKAQPALGPVGLCDHCFAALEKAKDDQQRSSSLTVLCGSLYLVGYFLQYHRPGEGQR